MMNWKKKEWFGEWFDSPYYHILYKNRDDKEAQVFMRHLVDHLPINTEHKLLDVACGKGRHSIFLNSLGFDVTGIDLSEANIEHASKFENERLHFAVHDMREVYQEQSFDFAFNLFTSFGYFDNEQENQLAITAIADALKPGGYFVLDFLNPYKVINNLVDEEVKEVEGIEFHINRAFENGYIKKYIQFEDNGNQYTFWEKVQAIRRIEFLDYFRNANLLLKDTFGDYDLNDYEPDKSDRMIFICQK